MDIKYTKYGKQYDPIAFSWLYDGCTRELDFNYSISALYSEKIDSIVVEIYEENKLNFYSPKGELLSSESIPRKEDFQFRGINKNLKSKTGISFLFHPLKKSEKNKWGDTEQYEMLKPPNHRLGKFLNIYR